MDQDQAAPPAQPQGLAAPQALPGAAAAPPVLPAPPIPPPPVVPAAPPLVPAAPPPPAFALGPGRSHAVGQHGYQTVQQSHSATGDEVRRRGRQLGRLPSQRTRSCPSIQLAPAHHRANRRRYNQEPSHSLWPSLPREYKDPCHRIHQHTYARCARQRHVLLFPVGLVDE